jgi:hypothetical protein
MPSMMETRYLAHLTTWGAQSHLDAGRPDLAAELLLDGMQMAGDHMRSPALIGRMIGCALLTLNSSEALFKTGMLEQFPEAELKLLSNGMEILAAGLQSMESAWDLELAWFIRSVSRAGQEPDPWGIKRPKEFLSVLCFGLAGRGLCAEYVEESMRYRALQLGAEQRSWQAWKADWQEHQTYLKEHGNGLWSIVPAKRVSAEISYRSALTLLNLTRCAIAYRLTDELVSFPDPFGGQLELELEEGVLSMSSVCPDNEPVTLGRYRFCIPSNDA